ncbi:hypothetical protein [Georgenia sp. AZ-5]|uniref:hypothetical protein n=1 Tax=Georgenia sp. AZ-5 TaxID=3367526 RepID=UPI003754682E
MNDKPSSSRPSAPRRVGRTALLVAAAGALAISLSPSGGTAAAWRAEVAVPVAAVTMDSFDLRVDPVATGSATVSTTATAATAIFRPAGVVVTDNGSDVGSSLPGTGISYSAAKNGSCTAPSATWSVATDEQGLEIRPQRGTQGVGLAPREAATLCLHMTPGDELQRSYGGKTLTVETTLAAVTPAPATWTASTTWVVEYQVPRQPEPEPAPVVRPPSPRGCVITTANEKVAAVSWTWSGEAAPVAWDLLRWDGSAWVSIDKFADPVGKDLEWPAGHTLPAEARSATIRPGTFDGAIAHVKVRAYTDGGTYNDSAEVFTFVGDNGASGHVECGGVVADPHPGGGTK